MYLSISATALENTMTPITVRMDAFQGNRISDLSDEFSEKCVVPAGFFDFSPV